MESHLIRTGGHEQLFLGILGHQGHPCHELPGRTFGNVCTVDPDGARKVSVEMSWNQGAQYLGQCRFPTIWNPQDQGLGAFPQGKVHRFVGRDRVVPVRHIADR